MYRQLDFFNTISLAGPELAGAEIQATNQNDRILQIMSMAGKMTPFQVSEMYDLMYTPAPITSIRRSMTVLTEKGLLEKCDHMKVEKYGMKNHYWRKK